MLRFFLTCFLMLPLAAKAQFYNGGNPYNLGATWATYSPTVTALSGALTTVSASIRYQKIGHTVTMVLYISIPNNGSGGVAIQSTLPFTPAQNSVVSGRERASTGSGLEGDIVAASNLVTILTYSNGYPAVSGCVLVLSGVYESVN